MIERIVLRGGDETPDLLRAAARVVDAAPGPVAIIGGVAVTCRLAFAHRATTDLDTVVDEHTPSVIEVLADLEGAEMDGRHHERVVIDGVAVDVISTMSTEDADVPDGIEELFVLAHRFALESATPATIVLEAPEEVEVALPIATPAGLVATKLCGVQGLRRRPPEKRATDGYDIYRLLRDLDGAGAIARAIYQESDPLLRSVRDAATTVLLRRGAEVVRAIATYGAGEVAVTLDDLTFVAERFVDNLDAMAL